MSSGVSVPSTLGDDPCHTLLVNRNGLSWSYAKVTGTTQTIIGNGKRFVLISRGLRITIHLCPGSCYCKRTASWQLERPTMLMTYIRVFERETDLLMLVVRVLN
jgi:hypothetical protein